MGPSSYHSIVILVDELTECLQPPQGSPHTLAAQLALSYHHVKGVYNDKKKNCLDGKNIENIDSKTTPYWAKICLCQTQDLGQLLSKNNSRTRVIRITNNKEDAGPV